MSTIDIHNDKFVDMTFITSFTGMTDKWFYKLMQEGKFPHPVKFGRSSRWLESEVTTWFEEQLVKSRQKYQLKNQLSVRNE